VHWEHFVRGTEPGDTCDLHRRGTFFRRITGWFRQ